METEVVRKAIREEIKDLEMSWMYQGITIFIGFVIYALIKRFCF
jgi:hypothetical protein